ncbi:hypothetical protein ADL00_23990 [Streptomyces sp. AS58]|nr:hypothetical protein ADL00_23990 [Streptomyces sp. AS58]
MLQELITPSTTRSCAATWAAYGEASHMAMSAISSAVAVRSEGLAAATRLRRSAFSPGRIAHVVVSTGPG